ncbi:MAG: (d)CMP kinase [Alphaproteobacteria bacterium]|jgi:cytidylate kinase|nr:(d)CMP kinase [Candidatus Jidaibacter sp.]
MNPFIISIDGVAASGKGTLSERLAQHHNFDFLDTGKMYRKLGYHVIENKIDFNDVESILKIVNTIDFSDLSQSLHTDDISHTASQISKHPDVRESLNIFQKTFPIGRVGCVIDGRDIGTVIFPDADIKFFITADVEIRADRRFKQLQKIGKDVSFDSVLRDLKERDYRDIHRQVAPTVAADDAIVLNTSNLNADSTFELAKRLTEKAVSEYFSSKAVNL